MLQTVWFPVLESEAVLLQLDEGFNSLMFIGAKLYDTSDAAHQEIKWHRSTSSNTGQQQPYTFPNLLCQNILVYSCFPICSFELVSYIVAFKSIQVQYSILVNFINTLFTLDQTSLYLKYFNASCALFPIILLLVMTIYFYDWINFYFENIKSKYH